MSETAIVAPRAPTVKAPAPAKVGDEGQPTVKQWHAEINNDLKVALGKMGQMPPSGKKALARVMRAIQVHLTT
jgi:hypothetical protein